MELFYSIIKTSLKEFLYADLEHDILFRRKGTSLLLYSKGKLSALYNYTNVRALSATLTKDRLLQLRENGTLLYWERVKRIYSPAPFPLAVSSIEGTITSTSLITETGLFYFRGLVSIEGPIRGSRQDWTLVPLPEAVARFCGRNSILLSTSGKLYKHIGALYPWEREELIEEKDWYWCLKDYRFKEAYYCNKGLLITKEGGLIAQSTIHKQRLHQLLTYRFPNNVSVKQVIECYTVSLALTVNGVLYYTGEYYPFLARSKEWRVLPAPFPLKEIALTDHLYALTEDNRLITFSEKGWEELEG